MSTKIKTDYIILESKDKNDLETQVRQHLEDGWDLSGGIGFSAFETSSASVEIRYAQAMTMMKLSA